MYQVVYVDVEKNAIGNKTLVKTNLDIKKLGHPIFKSPIKENLLISNFLQTESYAVLKSTNAALKTSLSSKASLIV